MKWFCIRFMMGLITYFGSRFFGTRDKKYELKYNLFQEMKIESINTFLEAYSNSQLLWNQLPYNDIIDRKLTAKEIDNVIMPIHNQLHSSYYNCNVILNSTEMIEFTEIDDSFNGVQAVIRQITYSPARESLDTRIARYEGLIFDTFNLNRKRLILIGEKFRKQYN